MDDDDEGVAEYGWMPKVVLIESPGCEVESSDMSWRVLETSSRLLLGLTSPTILLDTKLGWFKRAWVDGRICKEGERRLQSTSIKE